MTGPGPVFYDTWKRIQPLTCPGGEVLTFKYDSGGDITKKTQTAVKMPHAGRLDYRPRPTCR